MNNGKIVRLGLVVAASAAALLRTGVAAAAQYGELHVSSNKTLRDDQFGNIVFDASNVTLDCAGFRVHISSATKGSGPGGEKVGIFAEGRSAITIKNCNIIGGFYSGLWVRNSTNVLVDNVYASVTSSNYPFIFEGNQGTFGRNLTANNGFIDVTVSGELGGKYSFNVTGGYEGIHLYSNSGTQLVNSTFTGTESVAIVGAQNSRLTLQNVDVENCGVGFESIGDQSSNISSSTFSNNAGYGIALYSSTSAVVSSVHAQNNFQCDAYEETSSGDSWRGNTFGTICGSVPASH